ncbi:VWA domain-containing protein [Bacillus sp. B1-b2]|uniref:VWA domain-containing protein n=1 Tax=Bacillus sp. B1-b2 TaxID=2653201 RepID=UPI001261BD7A|nr:VWA domain-containing protein [Bacillus sp. B1-b2]KAB7668090.1 VWA domain-containing protein [Bacillus sp. B1-b2]
MRRTKLASKFLLVPLLLLLLMPTETNAAAGKPAVNFTVTPSQGVIVKPSNGIAQGSLDVRLTPEGKATNANRSPIDVVFVFDKSGSMNESGRNPYKFESAKNAMYDAVKIFSADPNIYDRFGFVPFDSDIDESNIVKFPSSSIYSQKNVRDNLSYISNTTFRLNALGGTNYTQSLQKASSMLALGNSNASKYIFFMTDGEPTVSTATENINNRDREVTYTIYTNNTATRTYQGYNRNIYLNDAERNIKAHIQKEVESLTQQDIKLYSIGFGNNKEVDMGYLNTLSLKTGATAQQASTDTISKIFEDISTKISTPTITATIKINISKFKDTVKLADDANATTDSAGNIIIKKDILFPINQDPSGAIDISLPLTFSKEGKYEFDNITLQYTDLDGKAQSKSTSATIEVKSDAPATFSANMTLEKVQNELSDLIKTSNSTDQTNHFNVKYTMNPTGLVNSAVSGILKNLVIEQPLPDSVSVVSTENVKAETRDINGTKQKYAIITVPNEANYSNGLFRVSEITKTIQYKVDHAVSNLTMPRANLYYVDSPRFADKKQTTTIAASQQSLNMKVQLKEFLANKYTGDAAGIIEKRDQGTNNKLANSEFPNDYGLQNKPVKDMIFKEGSSNRIIEITYSDNTKAYLNFVPDFDLTGQTTATKYNSGATTTEYVNAKLTSKVAGSSVTYSYKVDNVSSSTGWKELDPTKDIPITSLGNNTISIKASGGFSNNTEVIKTITITRPVTSLVVNPNPIELNIGGTKSFTVDIQPTDATNKNLNIRLEDTSIASLVTGQNTITGNKVGTTYLLVSTTNGPEIIERIPVNVIDPYVRLDNIKFKQDPYQLELSDGSYDDLIPVEDLLTFNPTNATDKDIVNVVSNRPEHVEVVKINGDYYIKGVEVGYAQVTATAEKQKDGTQPKASTNVQVVKDSDNGGDNGSGGSNSGSGRW